MNIRRHNNIHFHMETSVCYKSFGTISGFFEFLCIKQGQEHCGIEANYYGMMSQSVVLECQQGSQIWLEASTSDCGAWGSSSERESVFSGFILQCL